MLSSALDSRVGFEPAGGSIYLPVQRRSLSGWNRKQRSEKLSEPI